MTVAALNSHVYRGGAELDVNTHARDQLEVRVEPVKQRFLLLKFAAVIGSEPIECIGDSQDVEVEAAQGNLQGLVLQGERMQQVLYVFVVRLSSVRCAGVRGINLGVPYGERT